MGKYYGHPKHGCSRHPLYSIWNSMKYRCNSTKSPAFYNYGGRGIKVCPEWENDVKAFIEWSVANGWQKGLQLDRIDNSKGYSPDNCRYVTAKENMHNRRPKEEWWTREKGRYSKTTTPGRAV